MKKVGLLLITLSFIWQSCTWLLLHPEVVGEAEEVTEEVFQDVEKYAQPQLPIQQIPKK